MKEPLFDKLKTLDQETNAMFDLVEGLSEDELHDKAYGWSIIQVYAHLNMAEAGSVHYMKKKMQAGSQMPNFSTTGKIRYVMTKRLLESSLKWKAPKVVAVPKEDYSLEEIREEWATTRAMTKKYVKEYPDELLSKAVYKHPFAGRLDLEGAIGSFIYHQRHHRHQIKRIMKMIK